MVKKIILITILIIFFIFPPLYPKSLIKGEKENLKDFYGFIFTYFNPQIERDSFFTYKVKGYEKKGIVLKNINSGKSFIYSSEGNFLYEGDINGAILIYFKEEKNPPPPNLSSLKDFHSSYIYFQDELKELSLTPFIDLEKDEIYLENENSKIFIGKENFKKRIQNVILLLKNNKLTGILDASFDDIIVIKGNKEWKI